ncbi:MAG: UMP kinase [Candidatus Woesearchaeota archaeon]
MKKTIILSLGGSLIIPKGIDVTFLTRFRRYILKNLKKYRFIIVTGGGSICRHYVNSAMKIRKLNNEEADLLGIEITKLNAYFIALIFKNNVDNIVNNPTKKYEFNKILVASGWKPGCSTDYDAVLFAKTYKVRKIINLSDINYIYDKDPILGKAKKYERLSWDQLEKIQGKKWEAGLHKPFDPRAVSLAKKIGLKLIVINGRDLYNLNNILKNKKFKGTVVS